MSVSERPLAQVAESRKRTWRTAWQTRRAAVERYAALGCVGLALGVGCGSQTANESDRQAALPADTTAHAVDSGLGHDAAVPVESAGPPEPVRCYPATGTTGSPRNTAELIDLLNGLPKPVTIPCFLQSLDRPLQMVATYSVISAQPAQGTRSPRIFLLLEGLVLSVVPDGKQSELLELGELTSTTRSLKGELHFPIEENLAYSAPFERIMRSSGGGTVCAVCHGAEELVEAYDFDHVYESEAFQVTASTEVNFDYVEYQYKYCDALTEPGRCAILSALFDQGEISRGRFPEDMQTFF